MLGRLTIAVLKPISIPLLRIALGIAEVALGAALIANLFVPWAAAIQVLHLLGTFAVFVLQPAVVHTGNPFLVTLEGEFIAKNLVLVAGLLVAAGYSRAHANRH